MYKEKISETVFRTNDGAIIDPNEINKVLQPAETLEGKQVSLGQENRLQLFGRIAGKGIISSSQPDSVARSPINAPLQPPHTLSA